MKYGQLQAKLKTQQERSSSANTRMLPAIFIHQPMPNRSMSRWFTLSLQQIEFKDTQNMSWLSEQEAAFPSLQIPLAFFPQRWDCGSITHNQQEKCHQPVHQLHAHCAGRHLACFGGPMPPCPSVAFLQPWTQPHFISSTEELIGLSGINRASYFSWMHYQH